MFMMKTSCIAFIIAAAALLAASSPDDKNKQPPKPAAGIALYVSPSGNDRNPGTKDQPVRTLQHARDLVRRLNQKMSADITVYLSGGVHRLTEPLALDPADSGMNGHNVIYTAAADERPVISGAAWDRGQSHAVPWPASKTRTSPWPNPAGTTPPSA